MSHRFPSRALSLLALTVASGLAACSADNAVAPAGDAALARKGLSTASSPAPSQRTARYEIDFMQDMIDHHAMAVMMAEMCVDKAVHKELRRLCQDIIAAQSAEIEQMQTWLQEWYGISYEPQMKPSDERMMEQMAALSPEEFEIEFLQMMIEHHEKAIREGETCLRRAYHPELIELCENIIETQTAEIELMQEWLCEWYGICQEE